MPKTIYVTKQSGEGEGFNAVKLRTSLLESGASVEAVNRVVKSIMSLVTPGMSTSEIYRRAFGMLRTLGKSYAARYSLRRSIMHLGPSGFPFEKYLANVLEAAGYQTHTNQIFQGRCITHEVDVVAEKSKENIHAIIEAKFHSRPGRKTGAKDALYTYARFLDINEAWVAKRKRGARPKGGELQSWLVTNTKASTHAQAYCQCVGIKLISWDYPYNESLKKMIDNYGLYPVTVLISLNKRQKDALLHSGVVMCKDLLERKNRRILKRIGLNQRQQLILEKEVQDLVNVSP